MLKPGEHSIIFASICCLDFQKVRSTKLGSCKEISAKIDVLGAEI